MPTNYFENGVQIVGSLAFGAALKKSISLMNNGDVIFADRPDDPDLTKETIKWDAGGGLTLLPAITLSDKLTIALGTLTADKQALDVTATWNAAAVAFTLLKANVTDTASAAASLLMDLQVGGASKFKVDKAGVLTLGTALAVGQGGTGKTTLTADGVLLGAGTSAVIISAAGLADQVFRVPGAGGAPAFGALDLSKAAAVTGLLSNANLAAVGPGATGPIGSATVTPVITINAQGRVTALTSATISAVAAATQADMEAASSTTVYASPGTVRFEPGVAKVWAAFQVTGTVDASRNVTSVTDNAVGRWTPNFTTPFSTASGYAAHATVRVDDSTTDIYARTNAPGTGSIEIDAFTGVTLADPTRVYFVAFGDQ